MAYHSCFLGIDIGTSAAKAVVVDRQGRLLGWAGREYPIHTPRPGWAEQNPQDWLDAAAACAVEAVREAGIEPGRVAGVGLGGQMHSLVCLDGRGAPLRPAIIWADQRSAEQVQRLTAELGSANLARWTGNPLATGFMLASWAWLRENEPHTARQARWLLLPKDYVRFYLTGQIGTEPSDASSTLLFDPHQRQWSEPVLEAAGLSADRLPQVYPSHQAAGGLTREAAQALGLAEGVPVAFGGSDVSLQALAQCVIEPGTISCTIGTGGQLFAPLRTPLHDPALRLHLFCHALENTWHQEAAILSAGLSLRWLRDQLWPGAQYAALADAAQGVQAAADGLFFLPFLTGERTPYMQPALRAGFQGLGLRHGQAHLVRAVMEGVVFALRQGLDLMQGLGTPIERLVATGGAVRHPLWLQLQADIFNRTILAVRVEDAAGSATARGAAILAAVSAGEYSSTTEAIRGMVEEPVEAARPNPEAAGQYEVAYQEYCRWAELVVDHYGL